MSVFFCSSNLLPRPLVALPPLSSKKPRSSTKLGGYSSRLEGHLKSDILLSPFESYAEMMLGDGTSNVLKGESSPQTSVKVVSPNKKRVSPPRIGTGLSPICKSGRKLILKSIPSFPSLGVDITNEDPNTSSLAPWTQQNLVLEVKTSLSLSHLPLFDDDHNAMSNLCSAK